MASSEAGPVKQKLSIYPAAEEEILLLNTPSDLELKIGETRRAVAGTLREAHSSVQGLVSQWIGIEGQVEARLKSLHAPNETLTPGALYAATALLAGTILTRHRAFPLRFLTPPIFGAVAFAHFLPQTSANIRAYASDLEDAHMPEVARFHETGKSHAMMGWERLKEGSLKGKDKAGESVLGALEKLQELTGLKVTEALGVVREMEKKAEGVVEEVVGDVLEKKESVQEKVDEKVQEKLV
ncbi:unnamed protein product [Mycena citricolor]|uniref:MICOS complex subunit n=1 Tax=Mycena citricolor TaxID=2018698 RepID=A0AAD2Q6P6_9AGAR|nr:unnamed protein product [Mycena citricolor]